MDFVLFVIGKCQAVATLSALGVALRLVDVRIGNYPCNNLRFEHPSICQYVAYILDRGHLRCEQLAVLLKRNICSCFNDFSDDLIVGDVVPEMDTHALLAVP
jgi:hypothetical protein